MEKGNKNLDVDKNGIMRYAKQHFKTSMADNAVWNGRRIQNAFKVATALAHWEAYSKEEQGQLEGLAPADDDDRRHSTLSATQFKTYATGTRAFDTYFQEATGMNDADRAYHAMERADGYAPEDGFHLSSPGYDENQFSSLSLPHEELRRTSSMSLVPPSTQGRGSSPNLRPQLGPRLSTSQLPQHQRSPTLSRQNASGTPTPMPHTRRRSSQLTTLASPTSPMLRRPSNDHRGSFGHDLARQNQAEHDDTGVESDESDDLDEDEAVDEDFSSDE